MTTALLVQIDATLWEQPVLLVILTVFDAQVQAKLTVQIVLMADTETELVAQHVTNSVRDAMVAATLTVSAVLLTSNT